VDQRPTEIRWTAAGLDMLPEEWLLFDLAKTHPSQLDLEHAVTLANRRQFSWERAWTIATRLWVHPLLAKNVRDHQELTSLVPRELKPALALSQFAARSRQSIYFEATSPVFVRLAAAGIRVVLLKGGSLLSRYPAGTRPLNDLDLLIRRDDYAQVAAALTDCGFQRVLSKEVRARGKGEEDQLRIDHEMSFVKYAHKTPLSVDLHWSLHNVHGPFVIDNEALMSKAVPMPFGEAPAWALSPEDMLIDYASQLITDDLTVTLLRLADIHTVVSGGVRWPMLCDIAIRAQAAGATHLVLSGARLMGADVPEDVFRRFEEACHGCRLGSEIVAEPRWPLDRFKLAGSARNVLTPLFCSSTQYRRTRIRSLPKEAFRYGKRMGRTTLQCYATAGRAIVLSAVSAIAILGLRMGTSAGGRALTRPLRDLLWRRRDL
jgi:Uncharacterised nucleotidyltransferase